MTVPASPSIFNERDRPESHNQRIVWTMSTVGLCELDIVEQKWRKDIAQIDLMVINIRRIAISLTLYLRLAYVAGLLHREQTILVRFLGTDMIFIMDYLFLQ